MQLVRLTPKISWSEASLIEPLAISVQMSRQAGLKALQHVMILGRGLVAFRGHGQIVRLYLFKHTLIGRMVRPAR